jgi:hypothetical protein
MTRLAATSALALLFILTIACGDDDARVISVDAATGTTDGGGRVDGGGTDSGAPTDSGTVDECPPTTAPLPTGMVCSNDTLSCLMTATTAAAQQMCFEEDPDEMCEPCVQGQVLNCATAPGLCDAEFADLACCTAGRCGGISDPVMLQMCASSNCGGEVAAFQTCFMAALTPPAPGTPPTCGITMHCFGA